MEDTFVLVGKKPVINYVMTCVRLFQGCAKEISVKAREYAIDKNVSAIEALRRRFLPNVRNKSIDMGTEQLKSEDGRILVNVSTVEIALVY